MEAILVDRRSGAFFFSKAAIRFDRRRGSFPIFLSVFLSEIVLATVEVCSSSLSVVASVIIGAVMGAVVVVLQETKVSGAGVFKSESSKSSGGRTNSGAGVFRSESSKSSGGITNLRVGEYSFGSTEK